MNTRLLGPFWLVSAALTLSLAWLLPNHTPPWLTFHSDAWVASILTLLGLWVTLKGKATSGWQVLTLGVGLCCLIPWVQYALGQVLVFGTAWINSIYMLGFLLALITGEAWELESPGQCADLVFIAVATAAVVSTGLQLRQWAGLDLIGPWTLHVATHNRFYANMPQPNQLASLLLLGIIGCSWGFYRRRLGAFTALLLVSFILIGVVLTESRTASLNVLILLAGAIIWRAKLPSRRYLFVAIGLGLYFAICTLLLPYVSGASSAPELRAAAITQRFIAWQMFFEASLRQPFFGFGWGQLAQANFLVLENHGAQSALFLQSHNLLLDLILWNGYPLGLLLIGLLAWWTRQVLVRSHTFGQLHALAFVTVLGTHAMLEYPLQYAYFLLPLGLISGSMHTSLGLKAVLRRGKLSHYAIAIAATLALTITIRDYFRVETSFYGLRFEARKIQTDITATPPDVLALTQFREHIAFARNIPRAGVSAQELQTMTNIVNALPSSLVIYKLAANLAMNQRPLEASQWLTRLCKTTSQLACKEMSLAWAQDSLANPAMAAINWPDIAFLKTTP